MIDKDIMSLGKLELLNRELIQAIIDTKDTRERERLKSLCLARARELKIYTQLNKTFKEFEIIARKIDNLVKKEFAEDAASLPLVFGTDGKPLKTIENFLTILRYDSYFSNIRYNLMSLAPEVEEDGNVRPWTDADESRAKMHIESVYQIHNAKKFEDALRIFLKEHSYHPLKERIELVKWDGKERIGKMLIKWLKAEDTPYTREVSRLIFSGGINRLYHPGCKFDNVPVLIGTQQGEGKSTFIRWLSLDDAYFAEVCDIEGQKGAEILCGAWICEIAELLALTRAREIEAVKAYLSKQNDKYREPYTKSTSEHPRQCIFIGTTNRTQFLTDRTGNRRFFPVVVHSDAGELYQREEELHNDIIQCWAEAKAKYDKGEMSTVIDYSVIDCAREAQADAVEEDYRVGMIAEYLEGRQIVCGIELWQKALNNRDSKPNRKESNDIVLIMQGFEEWERMSNVFRFGEYGHQRGWRKKWENI